MPQPGNFLLLTNWSPNTDYRLLPMEIFLYSLFAAVIPTLLYVAIIYWVDRYEREPLWLLSAAFLWGAIPSIILALIFNEAFSIPLYLLAGPDMGDFLTASLIAPPVEEVAKGLALLLIFLFWHREIDSWLDGIIYGAMVGMGFAMVENIFYYIYEFETSGAGGFGILVILRGFAFGLNHALYTAMTGLGIAIARLSTRRSTRILAPLAGLSMAIFLHFLHNFSVSFGNLICLVAFLINWASTVFFVIIIIWSLAQERSWIRKYLREEVDLGLISEEQYDIATSGFARVQRRLGYLFSGQWRNYRRTLKFYDRCSKLAFRKHHYELFEDNASQECITRYRAEIMAMDYRNRTQISAD
jgi:protease PrsW